MYCVLTVCLFFSDGDRLRDYKNCTRLISTNRETMDSDGLGLTRGTSFMASHFELVAVAVILSFRWCVLRVVGNRDMFCFCSFLFERARPATSMAFTIKLACLPIWLSVYCLSAYFRSTIDRESCIRPISTNLVHTATDELGRTR